MVTSTFENIKISALATAVSNTWVDLNDYCSVMGEDGVEKFRKSTGISGKYKAGPNQATSDFAYAAAKEILEKKQVKADDIGALIMVTQTPDYSLPATACVLHSRLGLSKECIAFDVNLGCSGFVYGIQILSSILNTTNVEKGLLLVGDTSGKGQARGTINAADDAGKMLFGDAGAAVLMEKSEGAGKIHAAFRTDGSNYKAIISPFGRERHFYGNLGTLMDNIGVFNFTIDEVPVQIKEFMEHTNTTPDDYDCLALHQANGFIIKQVGKRAKFPKEKVLVSIDEYANTSSASIPTALTKHYGNMENEHKDINALMCGFGVGLSWSTVSAVINTDDILPLVHTDEFFDDGFGEGWTNDNK